MHRFTIETDELKPQLIVQVEDDGDDGTDDVLEENSDIELDIIDAVDGFRFPIATQQKLEELELAVRHNSVIRRQYIDLLRKQIEAVPNPTTAFLKLFRDKALANYNYSGRCNFSGDKKRAMKEYDIFVECINEAWGLYEAKESIRGYISKAITMINNRIRGARFRKKQKK